MSEPRPQSATGTPAATGTPTALAPHHLRLFALIVDYLLAVLLVNLGGRMLLGAEWDLKPLPALAPDLTWALGAAALLVLRDLPRGQSPGKWFTGIAAVQAAHPAQPPPMLARLLRNVALVLLPVEGVLVFTDRYCRRLGDHLAGTVVVSAPRPAPVTRRLLGMAILFLATLLAVSLVEYWNVRRSAAYPVVIQAAEADPQVRAVLGDNVEFAAPGLALGPGGETLHATLNAEGAKGDGRVEVFLRRGGPPAHWEVERITVQGPPSKEPRIEDAPKQ